jgi:hypothetical protein
MATEDDKVDTGALGTVVAVGAAGMIGISLAVNALVRHEVGVIGSGRDQLGEAAYRTYKDEQLQKLSAPPAWADQSKGQVSIPIEQAMKQVVLDLRRNPWNATPSPPPDAGTADAAAEAAPDAGADGAATSEPDAGAAAPEPPASAPLSPTAPPPAGSAPEAPKPSAPRTLPPPTVPPAPPPPASAPAQPAPPTPPATKP